MASLQQATIEPTHRKIRTQCDSCKHALSKSSAIYCAKLKRCTKNVRACPNFDPEPPEYRSYKRM